MPEVVRACPADEARAPPTNDLDVVKYGVCKGTDR